MCVVSSCQGNLFSLSQSTNSLRLCSFCSIHMFLRLYSQSCQHRFRSNDGLDLTRPQLGTVSLFVTKLMSWVPFLIVFEKQPMVPCAWWIPCVEPRVVLPCKLSPLPRFQPMVHRKGLLTNTINHFSIESSSTTVNHHASSSIIISIIPTVVSLNYSSESYYIIMSRD